MEARLRARTAAMGKDPAGFVRELIEADLKSGEAVGHLSERNRRSIEKKIKLLREWTASRQPLPYEVDDSRESIYEGRGE